HLAHALDVHVRPGLLHWGMGLAALERARMRLISLLLMLCAITAQGANAEEGGERPALILAIGAGGDPAYAETFAKWAGHWQQNAAKVRAQTVTVGLEHDEKECRDRLAKAIAAQRTDGSTP